MSAAAAAATANKENAGANNGPGPRAFSPTELKSMLGQCLKMASENKITPQNTWQLQLIEHLPELIREEGGAQTNFQVLGGRVHDIAVQRYNLAVHVVEV